MKGFLQTRLMCLVSSPKFVIYSLKFVANSPKFLINSFIYVCKLLPIFVLRKMFMDFFSGDTELRRVVFLDVGSV